MYKRGVKRIMELGILLGLAMVISAGIGVGYLLIERQRARYKLDNYARPPGIKPLSSFVCPDCLHRSYAPKHIEQRYCQRCDKSFVETQTEGA